MVRNHFRGSLFGDDFTGFDGEIALSVGDVTECSTNGDCCTDVGERAGQVARFEYFHVHDGFVSFDRGHNIAALDAITDLLFPGHQDAFGHGV